MWFMYHIILTDVQACYVNCKQLLQLGNVWGKNQHSERGHFVETQRDCTYPKAVCVVCVAFVDRLFNSHSELESERTCDNYEMCSRGFQQLRTSAYLLRSANSL